MVVKRGQEKGENEGEVALMYPAALVVESLQNQPHAANILPLLQ
jgi:hypothetical protein